jgi:hypothetical protein
MGELHLMMFDTNDKDWVERVLAMDSDFDNNEKLTEIAEEIKAKFGDDFGAIVDHISNLVDPESESQHILGNQSYTAQMRCDYIGNIIAISYVTED